MWVQVTRELLWVTWNHTLGSPWHWVSSPCKRKKKCTGHSLKMAGKTFYWTKGERQLQQGNEIDSTLLKQKTRGLLNTGISDWKSTGGWWGRLVTLPEETGRGTTFQTVPFQRGVSQVLEKHIPGWQKICISKGQRKSYNSKFPKVNALRKGRWGLQSEEACLTFSPGGDGKALGHPSHQVCPHTQHFSISQSFGLYSLPLTSSDIWSFWSPFLLKLFLLLLLMFFVLFCLTDIHSRSSLLHNKRH